MKREKQNFGFKAIIALLLFLLTACFFYISKMASDSKIAQKELQDTMEAKIGVMKELVTLKATYDEAINENSLLNDEIVLQRDKVMQLMNDLKSAEGNVPEIKQELQQLQKKYRLLVVENEKLKQEKESLIKKIDTTALALNKSVSYSKTLENSNNKLSKTVAAAAELSILNLYAKGFRYKDSGKETETDKASKANRIKLFFTLPENKLASPEYKVFYIQVLDSRNNVLGEKKSRNFGDNTLTYSIQCNVEYKNKTINVVEVLSNDKFAAGAYYINIYDKTKKVSDAVFVLN